jgi:hypothetical protein
MTTIRINFIGSLLLSVGVFCGWEKPPGTAFAKLKHFFIANENYHILLRMQM